MISNLAKGEICLQYTSGTIEDSYVIERHKITLILCFPSIMMHPSLSVTSLRVYVNWDGQLIPFKRRDNVMHPSLLWEDKPGTEHEQPSTT